MVGNVSDVTRSDSQHVLSALAYWYAGTLIVIIIGFLTLILRHA